MCEVAELDRNSTGRGDAHQLVVSLDGASRSARDDASWFAGRRCVFDPRTGENCRDKREAAEIAAASEAERLRQLERSKAQPVAV